jgi:hypothetical protein
VTVLHDDALEVVLPATPTGWSPTRRSIALRPCCAGSSTRTVGSCAAMSWCSGRSPALEPAPAPVWTSSGRPGRRGGSSRGAGGSPAALFQPPRAVDAAVLVITRRDPPLLVPANYEDYGLWVRRAARVGLDATLEAAVGRRHTERLRRARGVTQRTELTALRVEQWVRLFRVHRGR